MKRDEKKNNMSVKLNSPDVNILQKKVYQKQQSMATKPLLNHLEAQKNNNSIQEEDLANSFNQDEKGSKSSTKGF